MKKFFFLTASLLLFCLTGNAQTRKTWDFTQGWSDETLANLSADATNWSVTRNDDGSFKEAKDLAKLSGTIMANGVAIKELEGLTIGTEGLSKSNNFVLKPKAFRLTRKNMVVNLPKLASGQKIAIVAKSANAKATDRGLTANNTNMTKIEGPSDDCCTVGGVETTWVYQIVDGLEDSTDVSVKIKSGGVEIVSIVIDDGDAPAVEDDKKVAYIYNSTDYDEGSDYAWQVISGAQGLVTTKIDIAAGAADVTLDSLQSGYDVVVVSPYVNATDAYVAALKNVIAYEPMLNLNPSLYAAWGYGNVIKTEENSVTITDAKNALFDNDNVKGYIEDNVLSWLSGGTITGVTLGDYFAADDTLATVGAGVAIHKHNDGRNSYLFLPYSKDEIAGADGDVLSAILPAAISNLAKSKKDVTAIGTPAITEEYSNGQTTITIAGSSTKAKIYYTLDGSDPSSASTPYSEPFTLSEPLTVKAIAYADGYTESKIAELTATIKSQVATPTISVVDNGATATVTISCATEGAKVYYNYSGGETVAESTEYTEAITVSEPVTITAIAAADGYINSEIASVLVKPSTASVRYDILTKFDANRTDYSNPYDETGAAKATYLFSWGNKAQSMYDTTQPVGEKTLKDINGNDSIVTVYAEVAAETLAGNNGEWIVESQGQVISWENTSPKFNIGDGSNYNPAAVTDVFTANDTIGITSYFLNFGAKTSGEPYNARLRTAKAYAGPFDIVAYIGQGNGSNVPQVEIQTSKDGVTWDSLAMANIPATKRLWSRTKVSYEGSDAVYVRFAHVGGGTKAMIYNAYLLNAGEHTKEWTNGINEVNISADKNATVSRIYNLNGVRQNTMRRGINIVRYSDGTVRKVMK